MILLYFLMIIRENSQIVRFDTFNSNLEVLLPFNPLILIFTINLSFFLKINTFMNCNNWIHDKINLTLTRVFDR